MGSQAFAQAFANALESLKSDPTYPIPSSVTFALQSVSYELYCPIYCYTYITRVRYTATVLNNDALLPIINANLAASVYQGTLQHFLQGTGGYPYVSLNSRGSYRSQLPGASLGLPSSQPSRQPTQQPTQQPSSQPTRQPTRQPSQQPTGQPTRQPSGQPTRQPTMQPTGQPTCQPTQQPTMQPSQQPSTQPSTQPSAHPTITNCPHIAIEPRAINHHASFCTSWQ